MPRLLLPLALVFSCVGSAQAAHPLITEDTGTQGPESHQIEFNADWATDVHDWTRMANLTYTQGVVDGLDLFINTSSTWGAPAGESTGLNDLSIGAKWIFFDNAAETDRQWGLGITHRFSGIKD